MYLQVQNTAKQTHNTIRSTKDTLIKDIKKQGWNIQDCSVKEIRSELVDTKYRGADGKNIPSGQKQYKTRAKSRGNLNMKVNVIVTKPEVAVVS
jgi:hypothetical protein